MLTCFHCRNGDCNACPDKIFLILRKEPICTCQRAGHEDAINGEPRTKQIQDPFTEDIHGPHAVVRAESGVLERTSRPNPDEQAAR